MSVSDLDRDLGGQVLKEDPERVSETLPRTLFGNDFDKFELKKRADASPRENLGTLA